MTLFRRHGVASVAGLALGTLGSLALPADAQDTATRDTEYTVNVLPPGGPPPRLPNGHPDLSGHWFPNGAGQGVSGRFGVDPAARGTFDPSVTPEPPPVFQPGALERIQSMTPIELELSKSSVNCMPRGVPAIWLQNPYTTLMVHKGDVLV